MSKTTPQTFEFQAEIKQLLDIVIHSLYTEKEIFVRELVSNASDALEKLRHNQITNKDILDSDSELEIRLTTDDKAKTLTLQDTGIGMTRTELVENLGTIAHSGSKAFLKALGENGQKNSGLIGQFGVGFYSAFMVAKSVSVYSRSWNQAEPGHVWKSDGSGSYTIEEVADLKRGSKIVIELKDECSEFSQEWRIKEVLERYSSFVSFPVMLNGNRINTVQALWLRNKADIKEEEYTEFYKFQSHSNEEARLRLHFSADAPLSINALLFVPKENTEKLGIARTEPAVSLYCRKVLIDAKPKDLLPEWLRFLKGVVDSEDLPLNISRETMQDRSLLEKLGRVISRRFLKFLEDEAKNRPEAFNEFYTEFGVFLKEGTALDFANKEQLSKLLRFESSLTEKGKTTSLSEYVTRMGADQKEIYYLLGQSREAIEAGPYLEGFKARNIEVLYCYEAVDEYVMNNLYEFDSKKLRAADNAEVKLADAPTQSGDKLSDAELSNLTTWLKTSLGDRVAEVKASDRLVDSPAMALNADKMMTPHMRRMMKAMNKEEGNAPIKVNLEINPKHPLIKRLSETSTKAPDKALLVAEQILDNALISAGLLEDPASMVKRLYRILENV
jgi:TNF receptor-associated protein 1